MSEVFLPRLGQDAVNINENPQRGGELHFINPPFSLSYLEPGPFLLEGNHPGHWHVPVLDNEGPAFPDHPQVLAQLGLEFRDPDGHGVLSDARIHFEVNVVLHDHMLVISSHFVKPRGSLRADELGCTSLQTHATTKARGVTMTRIYFALTEEAQ